MTDGRTGGRTYRYRCVLFNYISVKYNAIIVVNSGVFLEVQNIYAHKT